MKTSLHNNLTTATNRGERNCKCAHRNVNRRTVRKCLFRGKMQVSSTPPAELDFGLLFKVHCLFIPSQGTFVSVGIDIIRGKARNFKLNGPW